MIVIVKWKRRCLTRLESWVGARAHVQTDAENYLCHFVDSIEAELIRSQGHPHGSFAVQNLSPTPFVWEFRKSELWIVYVVSDRGGIFRRFLGWHSREITIAQICEQPPDARSLLLLPS